MTIIDSTALRTPKISIVAATTTTAITFATLWNFYRALITAGWVTVGLVLLFIYLFIYLPISLLGGRGSTPGIACI